MVERSFGQVSGLGVSPPWRSAYDRCDAVTAVGFQVPVLISLHVAMRPFPLSATGKGLLVGLTAVAGSFALGWLVKTRTTLGRQL